MQAGEGGRSEKERQRGTDDIAVGWKKRRGQGDEESPTVPAKGERREGEGWGTSGFRGAGEGCRSTGWGGKAAASSRCEGETRRG